MLREFAKLRMRARPSPGRPASAGGWDSLTPFEVAARWRARPGLVFFDTAGHPPEPAPVSLLAARPDRIIAGRDDAAWGELERELARRRRDGPDDGLPHGFAAGWVAYDGRFRFGFYERPLCYRHRDEVWVGVGARGGASGRSGGEGPDVGFAVGGPGPAGREAGWGRPRFRPDGGRAEYCAMVRRAKEYIAAGDIYQVNLAHRFRARWRGDPFGFYAALREASPAPYGAFIDLGEAVVLSSSPELFLSISGRRIRTRPIKGTRPRRGSADADARAARELLHSAKENAELVMITDLERNDLGKICEYGTVCVPELLRLECYEQVFHLVSTVEGVLREDVSPVAALRACFPGGSITGAPKKRAMEIIAELEPCPRGIYTGAIGFFGFNGESRFNIAIRTAVATADELSFHVGAGIVADSDPDLEYRETLDKAAGLLLAAYTGPQCG